MEGGTTNMLEFSLELFVQTRLTSVVACLSVMWLAGCSAGFSGSSDQVVDDERVKQLELLDPMSIDKCYLSSHTRLLLLF